MKDLENKVGEETTNQAPCISKYAARVAKRKTAITEHAQSNDDADGDKPETTKVGKRGRDIGIKVPEHIVELAYIVKANSAMRRFVSLNILNYLGQKGKINPNATDKYVNFLWNKFQVTADGLRNEYSYREEFFLNALVASFTQFAKNSQEVIQDFMIKEGLDIALTGNVNSDK